MTKSAENKPKRQAIKTNTQGVYYRELSNGDKTYYIRYKDPNTNKLTEDKIGKYSEGIREAYCKKKRDEILHQLRHGEELPDTARKLKRQQGGITFGECFELYVKSKTGVKKTLGDDVALFNNHLKETFADLPMNRITPAMIDDFKGKLQSKKANKTTPLEPKTKNDIVGFIGLVFNFATERGLIKKVANPMEKVEVFVVKNKKDAYFTIEQATEIMNYFATLQNKRLYQLTVFLLDTGARFDEVVTRTWGDLRQNALGLEIFFPETKDGNDRWVQVSQRLSDVLDELKKEGARQLIITNENGEKYKQIPKQWQKAVDKIIPGEMATIFQTNGFLDYGQKTDNLKL